MTEAALAWSLFLIAVCTSSMMLARSRNSLTSSALSDFRLAGGLSFSKSSAAVVTDFFRSSRPASFSCGVVPLLTFADAA